MPQIKKLCALPSSILPKIELGLENVFTKYSIGSKEGSTYLPIFSDLKSSHILTSEAESDGSESLPSRPRKRQRLDHLSQEEKIMRRKMKNRVAAQTARDRKKARMAELEEQVMELETEKKMLLLINIELQNKNSTLQKENEELKIRLGETSLTDKIEKRKSLQIKEESKDVNDTESRLSDKSRSFEHAEGTGSANSYSLDDAIHLLTSNSETDALLDLLQQCSEDLLQCEDLPTSLSDCGETRELDTPSPTMVGTPSKSLEPHKELIHFDHIYYKQEDDMVDPVHPSIAESELSTKDSNISILPPLETECIIEVDNSSEIPVICISESPKSEPTGEILQFDDFSYTQFDDKMLSVDSSKPIPSPVSSDGGYDSSFSASSPCSSAVNSWDETLTELFPSLV